MVLRKEYVSSVTAIYLILFLLYHLKHTLLMVALQFYLINQQKDLHVANVSHGSHLQSSSNTHSE